MKKCRCMRDMGLLVCSVLMVGLLGCQTTHDFMADDPFFESWRAVKEESRQNMIETNSELIEAVPERLEQTSELISFDPSAEIDKQLPSMIIEKLDLTEETPVDVVLESMAEMAGQNIMIGAGVNQAIKVSFSNVPWNVAFKNILATAGLSFEWEDGMLRVLSAEDMQKKLEMDRLAQESQTIKAAVRMAEPLHVHMIPVKYGNAEKLGKTITQILVKNSDAAVRQSSVTVDPDSNTLIVHAIRGEIEKISRLVEKLDRPKPQVLIESKIVETSRNTARELGVQWGGAAQVLGGNRMHTFNGTGLDGFGVNLPANLEDAFGFNVGYTVARLGGGDVLELQLSALQEEGKVNILSSPSITTLDNETAIIEAGEERAYRKSSVTGNEMDVSVEWKEAKLKLEVTPHVIGTRLLKLDVLVNKDSFDESKPASNGEFPVNTKKARTTLLLRNGETTVIGGLAQESSSKSVSGVPFLKSLPLIGYLFQSQGTGSEFDEVMIFITPRVLLEKVGVARGDEAGEVAE
jgi:type IV pilus assembly protein PilQ